MTTTPRQPMHPADIKAALAKAGISQTRIAESLPGHGGKGHLSPTAVHAVVHGLQRSARIAQHISRLIGVPVSAMWPGAYPELEAAEAASPAPEAEPAPAFGPEVDAAIATVRQRITAYQAHPQVVAARLGLRRGPVGDWRMSTDVLARLWLQPAPRLVAWIDWVRQVGELPVQHATYVHSGEYLLDAHACALLARRLDVPAALAAAVAHAFAMPDALVPVAPPVGPQMVRRVPVRSLAPAPVSSPAE